MPVQTNESANREYRFERLSEMPERGATTLFDNCFFEGLDVVAEEGDVFCNCCFVGGSVSLLDRRYRVQNCTLERARLITRLDGMAADGGPFVVRGSMQLTGPMGPIQLELYDVDISAALADA